MSLALFGCRPPVAVSAVTRESAPTLAVAPAPASVPGDLDADGVPDASDRCPDEPEDRDEFEDEDGCVDRDNDGDGILDAFELQDGRWTNCDRREENGVEVDCRNRREDFDGDRDEDGCPDTLCLSQCSEPRLGEPVGLEQTGQLDKGAVKSLDDVAAALMAAPELLIRVEAHVDARSDAEAARRLTRGVAERVIEELVRRGVERARMMPIGWGGDHPLDPRTNAAARAANRRVEFRVRLDGCCHPLKRPRVLLAPSGSHCL